MHAPGVPTCAQGYDIVNLPTTLEYVGRSTPSETGSLVTRVTRWRFLFATH